MIKAGSRKFEFFQVWKVEGPWIDGEIRKEMQELDAADPAS